MAQIAVKDIIAKDETLDPKQIDKLAESFERQGQLHPLAVHKMNGQVTLIAG